MPLPVLASLNTWPFIVLAVSVISVIALISLCRLHAFLALILAALLAGMMAEQLPGGVPRHPLRLSAAQKTEARPILERYSAELKALKSSKDATLSEQEGKLTATAEQAITALLLPAQAARANRLAAAIAETLPDPVTGKARKSHWTRAVELVTAELGATAGNIALSIALASIIGLCLMESGAADKVVRSFLRLFGEKNAAIAILVSSYFLSIPIFFDTMFMLMAPLAMVLAMRTGRDYTLYVMCICAGAVVTHSLTIPHPGPLAMVDSLRLNDGVSLLAGILVGIAPVAISWPIAKWINRATPIVLKESANVPLADLRRMSEVPESKLPGFLPSIIPVVLPVLLISLASACDVILRGQAAGLAHNIVECFGGSEKFATVKSVFDFIGNKNIALLIGAACSLVLLIRQRRESMETVGKMLDNPLTTAGAIILITSAGGAFGLMLKNAGVGDAIREAARGHDINILLLGWLVAATFRIAQGSATVAMMTTAAMLAPMIYPDAASDVALMPYHPVYLYLSVGFGAFCCSWMNDSGFWVVSRLSGFTERETLRTWTVMLTVLSVVGLGVTLLLAWLFPHPL